MRATKHHSSGIQHREPIHYQIVRRLAAQPRGTVLSNEELWDNKLHTDYRTCTNKRNAKNYRRIEANFPGLVGVRRAPDARAKDGLGQITHWWLNWDVVPGASISNDINAAYLETFK